MLIAKGKPFEINPALWMDNENASLWELLLYKLAGGGAVVDAQPSGAGSMPRELLRISSESGIKIVASTGFHKLIFYPQGHWIFSADSETLAKYFTSDITEGLATDADKNLPKNRCAAKAGVIKCALDREGLDPDRKRLFKAAALAAAQTGAPLLIHTEDGAHALSLIDYISGFGIPPERMIICHAERSVEDFGKKLEIAKTGVYLECDTIAREKYHSDMDEALFIMRLYDAGYAGRVLLGLDTTRARLKGYGGNTGIDYILKSFLPMLRKNGFDPGLSNKICVENPAEALCFKIN